MEKTLGIIKPDAVKAGHKDAIVERIKQEGFTIVDSKELQLTREQAEKFYGIHQGKPFFDELVTFMISGPVVVLALEKESAIKAWRDLMGATNPAEAAENTLRKLYGSSIGENATHGSDAPETAAQEVAFFFPQLA